MISFSNSRAKTLALSASALSIGLMLSACPGPSAPSSPPAVFDATARLVFPRSTLVPSIDGVLNDAAWSDGFLYELEQGTMKPSAELKGVSTDTHFYLAMKVNGDHAYDEFDSAVFLINPDGTDNNYKRIVISPCGAGGGNCNGMAPGSNITPVIKFQNGHKNGASVAWDAPELNAVAGVVIKAGNIPGGTNNSWAVEMSIPRSGSALGSFNDNWMGLLANGIAADMDDETAVAYSWPQNRYVTGELDAVGGTGYPAIAQWGNATLSTAFGNGVSVTYNEFGSNQANPSEIALNAPNIFHAWAVNNQSTGGSLVAANDVTATFTIRNYGLGDNWPNVPVGGNPSGPVNIPAASAHLFETGVWSLNPQQVTDYTQFPNQCVRVTLTSNNANTIINQASVMRNMHFVTVNSPFEASANLSINGFEKRMDRENAELILTEEFINLDPGFKWQTRLSGAERIGENRWKVSLKQGGDQKLGVWVSPDDRLQLPSERVAIAPGTGGRNTKPVDIGVKPNSVVTLIADGRLILDDMPVTAGGIGAATWRSANKQINRGEIVKGRPERYGALLGSFDGFKTSFVVGNGTTFKVPGNAQTLSLIINDGEEGYSKQRGDGFVVQVIPSSITPWMLDNFPALSSKTERNHVVMPLGANLPTWILRGQYATRDYVIINGKRFRIHLPAGSFGYWIRDVGVNRVVGSAFDRNAVRSIDATTPKRVVQ